MTIGTYDICYSIASYVSIENENAYYKNEKYSEQPKNFLYFYVVRKIRH